MEGEGEGRRGEKEACWPAAPGGLGVEGAGEEQKAGQVEVWRERTGGEEVHAWCCEKGRGEPRRR